MNTNLLSKTTRFRAFQLGNEGSLFSYFDGNHFTLVEARLSELASVTLTQELAACGKEKIDTLHITSWDDDHCSPGSLEFILDAYEPPIVEYPGYLPKTDSGKDSLKQIQTYAACATRRTVRSINPQYISSLNTAEALGYKDVGYWPKQISEQSSNDNSTVKMFRTGSFNVASLGDVEDPDIAARLTLSSIFKSECDVLLLAHHGADNGFTNAKFLKVVKPTIAVCSSNYGNQYDHPKQEIRDLLYELGIPLFTTKTGDLLVASTDDHRRKYRVVNTKADTTEVSSSYDFVSKKSIKLNNNLDTIRNIYERPRHPFKSFFR